MTTAKVVLCFGKNTQQNTRAPSFSHSYKKFTFWHMQLQMYNQIVYFTLKEARRQANYLSYTFVAVKEWTGADPLLSLVVLWSRNGGVLKTSMIFGFKSTLSWTLLKLKVGLCSKCCAGQGFAPKRRQRIFINQLFGLYLCLHCWCHPSRHPG